MQRTSKTWVVARVAAAAFSTAVVLIWVGAAAAAPTTAQKCQSGKNKEAGKYAACRQKAEGNLATSGDTVKFLSAAAKCVTKLSDKWAALEQKAIDKGGMCPSTADEPSVESVIRLEADRLASMLAGTPRFSDNGDGTIADQKTGLMWEKKIGLNGTVNNAALHDADNTYVWSGTCSISGNDCQPSAAASAACTTGVEGNPLGCAQCGGGEGTCTVGPASTAWDWLVQLNSGGGFAGHTDWRLAKQDELASMIDIIDATPPAVNVRFAGASCGGACTDLTDPACSCTQTSSYWSSTSLAGVAVNAWFVSCYDGSVYFDDKTSSKFVRAVRGGL